MNLKLAFSYLRLSIEEEGKIGESSSIANQRMIVQNYCKQHNITIVREFVDDGWSGGNFNRPEFQAMIQQLEEGKANIVITKDLSRLGRDMREASYYSEQFFPEHGIHYIAIADNFDSEIENIMAPFQFAMNEVYLRDGSRKVKDVLRSKRADGQYCACPPYGYKKNPSDKARLVPDENTAPVVQRIFERAAAGDSSRQIAMDLNSDGVIPPLKYRVLYRDEFSEKGAARASDTWNYTTVKRILKNPVYLGHTLLGKSKKVSIKSKKKVPVPKEDWSVTENTHEPLVSQLQFDQAQANLGKGSSDYRAYDQVRKSIFSGIAFCAKCGHALCSCGTVYKGEREKYWYLSCINQRQDISNPCDGVRIRYADLLEVVRQDLNSLLDMSDEEIRQMMDSLFAESNQKSALEVRKARLDAANARMLTIDKIVTKLYTDNAEGKLDDERLSRMVADLEKESVALKTTIAELSQENPESKQQENYEKFFNLARQYSHIETLDRETLLTFVERIEVGPKELMPGFEKVTHRNIPYRQSIRIFYRFIGELSEEPVRDLPKAVNT
ncbi:recombinase family protein [Dysosmobacter sp.]|uniref:recombinase family protein n=1 Tax=Dysosmobacter sp. TaxID=2591382 RepID=UPI002A8369F2|nr:recombinase family protein [Dysosmobacter sp.]MCI7214216.1 recombinase family protein [Dysosmobacter sp.]MDY3653124.1 recombinase family protein [Dysosmobacter sp.]